MKFSKSATFAPSTPTANNQQTTITSDSIPILLHKAYIIIIITATNRSRVFTHPILEETLTLGQQHRNKIQQVVNTCIIVIMDEKKPRKNRRSERLYERNPRFWKIWWRRRDREISEVKKDDEREREKV